MSEDFYVGSAVNFKNRRWSHIAALKKNRHKNQFIQNSWNKYGKSVFEFSIIEEVDNNEKLIEREQYWMDILSPTFNHAKIAASPLGVKHTEKSRRNMSFAHKGKKMDGHKENCPCCFCDRKVGEESPRYLSREERYCACGCGKRFICIVTHKQKYINGHNKSQLGRKKTPQEIEKQRKSILKTLKLKNELQKSKC